MLTCLIAGLVAPLWELEVQEFFTRESQLQARPKPIFCRDQGRQGGIYILKDVVGKGNEPVNNSGADLGAQIIQREAFSLMELLCLGNWLILIKM